MPSRTGIAAAVLVSVRRSRVRITRVARNVIVDILDAIERDPHPRWRGDRSQRADALQGLLADLPSLFARVSKAEATQTLTTFHVLHWLSKNLDAICPIDKR